MVAISTVRSCRPACPVGLVYGASQGPAIVWWCARCASSVRASVARLRRPVASRVLEYCSGRAKIKYPVKDSAGYTACVVIKIVMVEETAGVWMWSRPACAGL